MGKKLVVMSELEYSVVSTVVVAAVVHYTRLAKVARGRSLSFSTMGFCCFTSLFSYGFLLKARYFDFDTFAILFYFILFNGHYFAVSRTLGYLRLRAYDQSPRAT